MLGVFGRLCWRSFWPRYEAGRRGRYIHPTDVIRSQCPGYGLSCFDHPLETNVLCRPELIRGLRAVSAASRSLGFRALCERLLRSRPILMLLGA